LDKAKNESDTQAGVSRQAIQSKASKLEKGSLIWLLANYFWKEPTGQPKTREAYVYTRPATTENRSS
jgi:hypothetical protein